VDVNIRARQSSSHSRTAAGAGSTGRNCRVPHLQPRSRRAGACGLKRSANLARGSPCVKPSGSTCAIRTRVRSPPQWRIDNLTRVSSDANPARRVRSGGSGHAGGLSVRPPARSASCPAARAGTGRARDPAPTPRRRGRVAGRSRRSHRR